MSESRSPSSTASSSSYAKIRRSGLHSLFRSKSLASGLQSTGAAPDATSLSSIGSSTGSGSLSRGSTGSVLGKKNHYSNSLSRGHKLSWNHGSLSSGSYLKNAPKNPRPERAQVMFEAVSEGLRDCINLAQRDLRALRSSAQETSSTSTSSNSSTSTQQIKAGERYLKRLEFQLSRLEELKELYLIHLKMRDGTRNMARAYVLSPPSSSTSSLSRSSSPLSSVKSGFRECTETLCQLEAEHEQALMGTFLLKMRGIQGFARLCPGDIFEISIRHGEGQKWKTRGKVLKNGDQAWDHQQVLLKALIGEILLIKSVEVRGLKRITLGHKLCEIKDLFSSHPQLMTVNLNAIGTLKLNLVITWNPLHGTHSSSLPRIQTSTPNRPRPQSIAFPLIPSPNSVENEELLNTMTTTTSGFSSSSPISGPTSSSLEFIPPTLYEVPGEESLAESSPLNNNIDKEGEVMEETKKQCPRHGSRASSSSLASSATSSIKEDGQRSEGSLCLNLGDAIQTLLTALEDVQGQYEQLHQLHSNVKQIHLALVHFSSRIASSSPSISRNHNHHQRRNSTSSVESALQCFSFLDGEEENNVNSSLPQSNSASNYMTLPISSGSEQLDVALMAHLTCCQSLLENLGSFGPLRRREFRSLDELQSQSGVLIKLYKVLMSLISNNVNEKMNPDYIIEKDCLRGDDRLRRIWGSISSRFSSHPSDPIHPLVLCITGSQFAQTLDSFLRAYFTASPVETLTIARLITARLVGSPNFEPDCVVSLFQVALYLARENMSLEQLFRNTADEAHMLSILSSGDAILIKKAVDRFRRSLPPQEPLFALALLLLSSDPLLARIAEAFFLESNKSKSIRATLLGQFLEGLEASGEKVRQSSCVVLMLLHGTELLHQLVYISCADSSSQVRDQAKEALLSCGDLGRKLYEESQLFANGFQGLAVK